MDAFLWIGSALGAAFGLVHGLYLHRQQTAPALAVGITGGRAIGFYYGLWAFALWTVFGAYVLAFWILGCVAYAIARFMPKRRTA